MWPVDYTRPMSDAGGDIYFMRQSVFIQNWIPRFGGLHGQFRAAADVSMSIGKGDDEERGQRSDP